MKSILSGIIKVLLTICLIPLGLGLVWLFVIFLFVFIPFNYFRLFILAISEVVISVFSGDEYKGRFVKRMTSHTKNYTGMMGDVLRLPLIPWKGNDEAFGHAKEFFEYERWTWIRMWYITFPTAIVYVNLLSFGLGMIQHVSNDFNQTRRNIASMKLEAYQDTVSIQKDSLNTLAWQVDSLILVQDQFYTNLDSIAQRIIDEIQLETDSLPENLDSLKTAIAPVSEPEPKLQEKKTNPPHKKEIQSNTVEEELSEDDEDEEVDDSPGKVCIRAAFGCGNIDSKVYINSQLIGDQRFWNPTGLKNCGESGTFYREMENGTYLISVHYNGKKHNQRVNIESGKTKFITITCED